MNHRATPQSVSLSLLNKAQANKSQLATELVSTIRLTAPTDMNHKQGVRGMIENVDLRCRGHDSVSFFSISVTGERKSILKKNIKPILETDSPKIIGDIQSPIIRVFKRLLVD